MLLEESLPLPFPLELPDLSLFDDLSMRESDPFPLELPDLDDLYDLGDLEDLLPLPLPSAL
jgi:hypothetical protein